MASCLSGPVASKTWCTMRASRPNPLASTPLRWTASCKNAMLHTQDAATSLVVGKSHTFAWQPVSPCKVWYTSARQLTRSLCPIFPALSPQGRPRRPPPSFSSPHPEGRSLGFLLERGRGMATAQALGGLKKTYDLWTDQRLDRLEGLARYALRSRYTVVQPGLQSGSMYVELLVKHMGPSSKGNSGLKFWVVSLCCPPTQACARLCNCANGSGMETLPVD